MSLTISKKYHRCKSGCDIYINEVYYPQRRGVLCEACFNERSNKKTSGSFIGWLLGVLK